ncbi:helix-turn-helix domain-containing protein [Paracoccus onubensis]|uniref:XRE family transcriptional regulator n=1 Tax=Paracoccus onubensis TaxID=1675788 RepID=A0A418SSW2_9RHOB|nr:helix-turn-helix transcriptional regulator [Paracoccus onubensis]RJE84012.1 XRE family transcriptional regulator [Paracoccus onubensis]
MEINEIFRRRLEAEMKAQGDNPDSLAKKAGMNRRAVRDILEGNSQSPKLSTVYKLATALNASIDELTGNAPHAVIAPRLLELLSKYGPDEQERLAEAILSLPRAPASEQ